MDFSCFEVFPRKSQDNRPYPKPTQVGESSRLRRWENYVEGTRQNDLVTSGEGVLNLEQSLFSDTKSGGATV